MDIFDRLMIYKTYISKFSTIISGSKINTGINPISELVYGRDFIVSRALAYFDIAHVQQLAQEGIMPDTSKMKHVLHITNAGSLDFTQLHTCETSSINDNRKIRATSFDLIFFLIPYAWDRGKGFDYTKNFLNAGYYSENPLDEDRLVSEDGCNWFQRKNGLLWDEEGIYTNEFLSKEYDKYACGEDSVVIGRQHFDVGNENIEVDITDTVNKFIDGSLCNYGIGIAYSPLLETMNSQYENYLGLVTDKTPTFFAPYLETRYDDYVSDDRSNFVIGKNNRLYLYCNIGDTFDDLDEMPSVKILDGDNEVVFEDLEVHKFSKGIYYVEVKMSGNDGYVPNTMYYDVWDNIVYKGEKLEPIEMDFTLKPSNVFFNIGNSSTVNNQSFTPSISGIMEKERIRRGDIRKLVINLQPNYTANQVQLIDDIDIRLYVMDGTRELEVITWDKVNKSFLENYYVIDTNMLLPQRYYIDIRVKYGLNSIIHHDVLSFDIVGLETSYNF